MKQELEGSDLVPEDQIGASAQNTPVKGRRKRVVDLVSVNEHTLGPFDFQTQWELQGNWSEWEDLFDGFYVVK